MEVNRDTMYQVWRELKRENWADFIVKNYKLKQNDEKQL